MELQTDAATKDQLSCNLGDLVNHNLRVGLEAQIILRQELIASAKQRASLDIVCEEEPGVDVFYPLTSTKCRAASAWINDMVAAAKQDLFDLVPTPVVSLTAEEKEKLVQKIKVQVQERGFDAQDAQAQKAMERFVTAQSRELYDKFAQDATKVAKKTAERHKLKIQDQLEEGNFWAEFKEFIDDVVTFPYAVMRTMYLENGKSLSWGAGGAAEVVDDTWMRPRRINPHDFVWAPWSRKVGEGFEIEVIKYTPAVLSRLLLGPEKVGLNKDKLKHILETYRKGYKITYTEQYSRDNLETQETYTAQQDMGTIDVCDYWDDVLGQELIDWGVTSTSKSEPIDPWQYYPVNLMAVSGICFIARLNPHPLGHKPFTQTSYEVVPGNRIGRGIPELCRPHQNIINSAARALRRNMGLSSGPLAEVDQARIAPGQDATDLYPLKVTYVTPDLMGGGHKAYNFYTVPSNAQELLGVINQEIKLADDSTGVPSYLHGNSSTAGALRTTGGLALHMGNASRGIKQVVAQIEHDVLTPIVQQYFVMNMVFEPDEALKGDIKVIVNGPSKLMAKEAKQQGRLQSMQLLGPFISAGVIDKAGQQRLAREVLEIFDWADPDSVVKDPEETQSIERIAQQIRESLGIVTPPAPAGPAPAPAGGPFQINGNAISRPRPESIGASPVPSSAPALNLQPARAGDGATPQPGLDRRSGAASSLLASRVV